MTLSQVPARLTQAPIGPEAVGFRRFVIALTQASGGPSRVGSFIGGQGASRYAPGLALLPPNKIFGGFNWMSGLG